MRRPTSGGRWSDRFPLAKEFVAAFEKKYNYKPEWSANSGYMQLALWADAIERAKTFYPPDVIKAYEAASTSSPRWAKCGSVQRTINWCGQ